MTKYDVFISHASKDKETVRLLDGDLRGQGFQTWYDTNEIEPDEDWQVELEEGIKNSTVLVLVWTEAASKSKWIRREVAFAEQNSKPIIPLVFDDTPLSIGITTTQNIDARNRFHEAIGRLISRLQSYVSQEKELSSLYLPYQKLKKPSMRSEFLQRNNYLDRHTDDFAVNSWTGKLQDRLTREAAKYFLTFLTVPFANPLDVDTEDIRKHFSENRTVSLSDTEDTTSFRFHFGYLEKTKTTQNDLVFFQSPVRYSEVDHTLVRHYLRIDGDGNVEYGDGAYSILSPGFTTKFDGTVFRLIPMLAVSYSIISLTLYTYRNLLDYKGQFDFLINLKNTHNATLGDFASNKQGRRTWVDRTSSDTIFFEMGDQGICTDDNVQLVYRLDSSLIQLSDIDLLINEISKDLQRAFNWDSRPRHLTSDSKEFPWWADSLREKLI